MRSLRLSRQHTLASTPLFCVFWFHPRLLQRLCTHPSQTPPTICAKVLYEHLPDNGSWSVSNHWKLLGASDSFRINDNRRDSPALKGALPFEDRCWSMPTAILPSALCSAPLRHRGLWRARLRPGPSTGSTVPYWQRRPALRPWSPLKTTQHIFALVLQTVAGH